jgi:hypothetical protein
MKTNAIAAMCLIFFITLLTGPVQDAEGDSARGPMLIRIDTSTGYGALPRGLDIAGGKAGEWIDVVIEEDRLYELWNLGLEFSVIIDDVEAHGQSVRGEYHTLAEMEQILQDIADTYPDITTLYSIGKSYEDRDIWCLEITDNPGVDEGEAGIFFMGLHHAREWPTVEICLHIADELTSNYGSDPDITEVVNNRRLWLVTCVNPDGYHWDHDLGHDWRKNRHYFPEFHTYGVDLNRNYAGSSNGDAWGAWGSVGIGSISNNPDSEVYCGPGPFSELETQAVRDVFLENDICSCITWHTYGELVMWPWGYSYAHAPDDTYMSDVGEEIASRITRQTGYGTYTPTQSSGLYPTTGDTTDWAYGFGLFMLGRITFAYTIEGCSSFQPSQSRLDQIVSENFDGALYLLQEAADIKSTVVPRVLPPVIDEMTTDPDGNFTVSWEERNPDAGPAKFQLDELTDLAIFTDDGESGTGAWDLDGFALSTSKSHSSSHSFKSRYRDEDVSSMTTVDPIPVSYGMNLSFWCWYDIEQNWDFAFVEVSRDGRFYEVLDTFTGYSGGWEQTEYSLDDYIGESIFLRFRYTTDTYTQEEGFYVDDIYPVADFGSITTLSNSITEHSYEVTGRPEGTYYYRVSGYNAARGWCDFSTLEDIFVQEGGPAIDIEIVPDDPPVTVPRGGSFTYTGTLVNARNETQYADVWLMVRLPNEKMYGPVEQINNIRLNPYQELQRHLSQDVPQNAPLGTYDFIAYCGHYPHEVIDESSFEVTVVQ